MKFRVSVEGDRNLFIIFDDSFIIFAYIFTKLLLKQSKEPSTCSWPSAQNSF